MNKTTTIYDIAKELNISAATVSRALNFNPKIRASTIELVHAEASRLNYKKNKFALGLKSGKSNSVGVIVPRIDMTFFASIIRGIEDTLQPEGYHVIICQTHENANRLKENISTLLNSQVDGILMSVSDVSEESNQLLSRVVKRDIPLVFFDRKIDIDGVSSVTINDYEGGYLATKNLISQGCKRIAHFSGDRTLQIYENRFNGYKQALIDSGIVYNEKYVIRSLSNLDAGKQNMKELLKLKNPPDALFSSSDFAALGAIQELKELRIKIPEEFCVFGFGNEPLSEFSEPSISSVDQSPMKMGQMAAEIFLNQISDTVQDKLQQKIVIEPIVYYRKSSIRV